MKLEDFTAIGIDDESAKKCLEVVKTHLKGFVPHSRFQEVIDEKNKTKEVLAERDLQLDSLKNSAGDVESLKETISKLQGENKEKDVTFNAELKKIKLENAVSTSIKDAKGKNVKAIKALLNFEEISILDDGNVKGLDSQIKELLKSEDTSFLFEGEALKPKPTGLTPTNGNKNVSGMNSEKFKALTAKERFDFSQSNPNEYNSLYNNGGN